MPWWSNVFGTISSYITIPGAGNYLALFILPTVLVVTNKLSIPSPNIFAWDGLYFRSTFTARLVRTMAFSCVLVPSPRPDCFQDRFFFPDSPWQFIKEMMAPRPTGGCNDLVVSGHTLFIWMTVCFYMQIASGWGLQLIKFVTPFILINIIMVRNHYSVDVFLGVAVSQLIWDKLSSSDTGTFQEIVREENLLSFNNKGKGVENNNENDPLISPPEDQAQEIKYDDLT